MGVGYLAEAKSYRNPALVNEVQRSPGYPRGQAVGKTAKRFCEERIRGWKIARIVAAGYAGRRRGFG